MAEILDEVQDEIRQEQIANFWKENGTFIVVSVILVILAVGGRSWWAHYTVERDTERTGALMQAIENDALASYVTGAEGTHAMIAGLKAAAVLHDNGDRAGAVARYDAIADNGSYPDYYRELAALLSIGVQAEAPDADIPALLDKLEPLREDSAYRASAIELSAFLAAQNSDIEAAISYIDTGLSLENATLPPDFKSRMSILRDYYEAQKS